MSLLTHDTQKNSQTHTSTHKHKDTHIDRSTETHTPTLTHRDTQTHTKLKHGNIRGQSHFDHGYRDTAFFWPNCFCDNPNKIFTAITQAILP